MKAIDIVSAIRHYAGIGVVKQLHNGHAILEVRVCNELKACISVNVQRMARFRGSPGNVYVRAYYSDANREECARVLEEAHVLPFLETAGMTLWTRHTNLLTEMLKTPYVGLLRFFAMNDILQQMELPFFDWKQFDNVLLEAIKQHRMPRWIAEYMERIDSLAEKNGAPGFRKRFENVTKNILAAEQIL